jgi:crotonobetainyl-CoA:carnitine CoA-transferase CaiB-like acyl-CoA transferase
MAILVPILLGLLAVAGAVAAVMEAASTGVATGRRVELSILAGLLTLVGVCLALFVYALWGIG